MLAGTGFARPTMFRIPAYDPFSIVLMGAGILLAAKLALSFFDAAEMKIPGRTGSDRGGVCFPHKERHPWLLATIIQAESSVTVNEKPQPAWERRPRLSWMMSP